MLCPVPCLLVFRAVFRAVFYHVCCAMRPAGVIHPSSVMVAAPTSAHLSVWSGWGATVAPSNDAVLRDCDLVLLAVPAERAEAVLEALEPPPAEQRTSRDRCFISLVPGLSRETIERVRLPRWNCSGQALHRHPALSLSGGLPL